MYLTWSPQKSQEGGKVGIPSAFYQEEPKGRFPFLPSSHLAQQGQNPSSLFLLCSVSRTCVMLWLCFTFLLLPNKYHRLSGLKQPPFISSQFRWSEVWVSSPGSLHKVSPSEMRVTSGLGSYLKAFRENPLPSSSGLLVESNSLWP